MLLFDQDIKRHSKYATNSVSHYAYINCSNRPEFCKIRNQIEGWIKDYPMEHREELISRFKTNNDNQFLSAFFELVLYELFNSLGYKISIHPRLENSELTPDFLITDNHGTEFYLEAVLSTGKSQKEISQQAILNDILDSINQLYTTNFFLELNIENYPNKPVPSRKIREFLENQLSLLDPDSCELFFSRGYLDLIPEWKFEYHGFKITFRPIPKAKEYRSEKTEPPIGIKHGGFKWLNEQKHILKSLKTKANKYKNLNKPFIIALNCLGEFDREADLVEALFGQEGFNYSKDGNHTILHRLNGFFHSKNNPRYTRVSAILSIIQLLPWTVGLKNFSLYPNPWAKYKLNSLNLLPKKILTDNTIKHINGKSLFALIGLPEKWPHDN